MRGDRPSYLAQHEPFTGSYGSQASYTSIQPLILDETTSTTQTLVSNIDKYLSLPGGLLTMILSILLVVSHEQGWLLSEEISAMVKRNRASTQLVVQILSNVFGVLQVTTLCSLINQATRLRLLHEENSLAQIQFWSNLQTMSVDWTLPSKFLFLLVGFRLLTVVPSALWAGAISPVAVQSVSIGTVTIPGYANISLIREYPSEVGFVPTVRSSKGTFAYNVGISLEGDFLSSAATATTVDATQRQHRKLDNSAFIYIGRSYGIAASVGLAEDGMSNNENVVAYTYQENGYDAKVTCIHNDTSEFSLYRSDGAIWLWEARGYMPNSNGYKSVSTYIGRGSDSIVAVGVPYVQTQGTKYLAIAAGTNYNRLDKIQCSIDYIPTTFNITVEIAKRKISIIPLTGTREVDDIDPSGNVTFVATRQLELISNDQTNLYQSLLGNSFLSSIVNYNISKLNSSSELTDRKSTLAGVTNSVTAMLDDILAGYASAQMMVGGQSYTVESIVTVNSLRLGERIYIWAITVVNLGILLVFAEEVWRWRSWKGLVGFDYLHISNMVLASSRGGTEISNLGKRIEHQSRGGENGWLTRQTEADKKIEKLKVYFNKRTGALVLPDQQSFYREGI